MKDCYRFEPIDIIEDALVWPIYKQSKGIIIFGLIADEY